LTNQRGQQGRFGYKRLDRRGVIVLGQEPSSEHAVKARHAPPNVRTCELKGQDVSSKRGFRSNGHGRSVWGLFGVLCLWLRRYIRKVARAVSKPTCGEDA